MTQPETIDTARREFFNERAEQWLDMWYADPETGKHTRHDKAFERLFLLAGLKPGDAALDLGCGSGVMVPYILDRIGPAGVLTEVDYAGKMIEVNRRLHPDPRVSFMVCSADELDVPAESFDAAFCFSCFPHFRRKRETLDIVFRTLRPGGKLIIAHFDSSHAINDLHRKHECVMHDHLPGEMEMRDMLAGAGYAVERFIDEPGFYYIAALRG